MIAILTFGKYRVDYPEPPSYISEGESKYIKRIQTLIIPDGFNINRCSLDYYGVERKDSRIRVKAEIIECKEIFFKHLYNQYTKYDFRMEVFDLSRRFPTLHSKYPQGLIYFTRDNAAERTYIEDAVVYEKEKIKRRLTDPYYDENERYLCQPYD